MSKTGAKTVEISVDHNGRRLDNYLAGLLRNAPKSFIYRIIRRGEVRVNGSRARPDRKLATADRVRIPPMYDDDRGQALVGPEKVGQIARSIIFENDNLLVINKPAGFAVHGGSGLRFGVIDIVRQLRPANPDIELVHRLDRDTSGCLVFAKNYPNLRQLQSQLTDPQSTKTYWTLLHGELPSPQIDVDLKLNTVRVGGEKRTVVADDGKAAFTAFSVMELIAGFSLTQARITTGRTHQIRVHAAAIQHPVAGDKKYAQRSLQLAIRKSGLRRMFLHARSITLKPAENAQSIVVEAPLPDDLLKFLSRLRCMS